MTDWTLGSDSAKGSAFNAAAGDLDLLRVGDGQASLSAALPCDRRAVVDSAAERAVHRPEDLDHFEHTIRHDRRGAAEGIASDRADIRARSDRPDWAVRQLVSELDIDGVAGPDVLDRTR